MNQNDVVPAPSSAAPPRHVSSAKVHEDSPQPTFHLRVLSPFRSVYDGAVFSVSAVNETGPFDVLPGHHNFMTILSPGELVVRAPIGDERITISRGILHMQSNNAAVFLDV